MYNYVMLIGKIKNFEKVAEDEYVLRLACRRPFKDVFGEYKTDVFNIQVPGVLGSILEDRKNNIDKTITVKGRLFPQFGGDASRIIAERIIYMDGEQS